jgi:hypothetical protein
MLKLQDSIVFEIEISALRNWLATMASASGRHFNPDKELHNFLQKFRPGVSWQMLDTRYYRHTQTMKVVYLKEHLGLTYREIQEKMFMSPNKIQKILKEGFIPARIGAYAPESFIEEWIELRQFLPNEIFSKWLK